MKIKQKILSILHNTTDLSKNLYKVDSTQTLTMLDSDYLYIGYRKELNQLYIELDQLNTNTSELTIEKWNGAWTEVEAWDETDGLSQSGFLFLEDFADEVVTTYEGVEQFWIRVSLDVTSTELILRLVNLLFNNLEDLLNDEPDIKEFYPATLDSHVFSMVASREYILRKINNSGQYKYKESTKEISQINQFDLFDINEVREASAYYTLHKIFSNVVNDPDDKWSDKADAYMEKFKASWKVFQGSMLSLDKDDSGEQSEAEKSASIQTTKLRR